jgi:hypothetical protein
MDSTRFFYRYTLAPYALSATALLIAIGGVILALFARLRERGTIVYFGATALVCAILITEPSQVLWSALPSANLVQFPWRLTLLIGLGAAIAMGSIAESVAALYRARATNYRDDPGIDLDVERNGSARSPAALSCSRFAYAGAVIAL